MPDSNASVLVTMRAGWAKTADAVQTLVCIRETQIQVGIYQESGNSAIRNDWDIRVVRWPNGEPLTGKTFEGPKPPPMATTAFEMSGLRPVNEAKPWIDDLLR
jgi:hypothetical protein